MLYSKTMKPVAFPPGLARLSTPDWIRDDGEHHRDRAIYLQQWPYSRGAVREDDFRRKCNQLRYVSASTLGVARGPARVYP